MDGPMTGFFDTYTEIPKSEMIEPYMRTMICDLTCITKFDNLANRLYVPVEVNGCNKRETYKAKAIWDTGSSATAISERLAEEMGLAPVDKGVGVSAVGETKILYYLLDIRMSNDIVIKSVKIAAFPLKRHDIDILLGMDVISKGKLTISNQNGKTEVTFEYNL